MAPADHKIVLDCCKIASLFSRITKKLRKVILIERFRKENTADSTNVGGMTCSGHLKQRGIAFIRSGIGTKGAWKLKIGAQRLWVKSFSMENVENGGRGGGGAKDIAKSPTHPSQLRRV